MSSVDESRRGAWEKMQANSALQRGSTPGGGGPTSGGMEARVAKLEGEMVDVRITLARIDEKLAHVSTRDDIARVIERISKVEGSLEGKLGYWQFVGTGLGIAGLMVAALALMVRPELWALLSSR